MPSIPTLLFITVFTMLVMALATACGSEVTDITVRDSVPVELENNNESVIEQYNNRRCYKLKRKVKRLKRKLRRCRRR